MSCRECELIRSLCVRRPLRWLPTCARSFMFYVCSSPRRGTSVKKKLSPAQISSKKEEETMEQQGTTTRLLPICLLHRINSAWKKEPARLKGKNKNKVPGPSLVSKAHIRSSLIDKRDNTNAMARTTPHQIPVRSHARSAGELYYIGTCYRRRHGSLIRYWPRYYMRHWPRFSISPAQ
jgi:hypothetical protein